MQHIKSYLLNVVNTALFHASQQRSYHSFSCAAGSLFGLALTVLEELV